MRDQEHKNESGKSSFSKVDSKKLFQLIHLQPGEKMLDAGCGKGEYTLRPQSISGKQGIYMPWTSGKTE
jgi:ubiquinone/menaquinone biosynthesis C-methylase UbiE